MHCFNYVFVFSILLCLYLVNESSVHMEICNTFFGYRCMKLKHKPPYETESLGSGESTEYLGIISFQLHTLTCQAVFSFYTPVSRDEAQAGHMHLGSAVQMYPGHVET